jgi:PKD repeat protein
LIDECGKETPVSFLSFIIKDAVSADFSYSVKSSCKTDTLSFLHPANNGVNLWAWSFDNNSSSTLQNPVKVFTDTGRHTIRLIASNGSCADTVKKIINLQNKITAAFIAPSGICPGDTVHLVNKSTGNIDNWQWSFGNGITSNLPSPSGWQYPITNSIVSYNVRLIAGNSLLNCHDTIVHLTVMG